MRVHLDPHTGQTVHPDAVPAYLAHPANHGWVVTLVPMLTFASPGPGNSPACGRADSPPTQSPHGSPAATPGGGSSPTVSGAISPHTHN